MNPLDKIVTYFEKFPGIGGRQARRFAFHILTLKPEQVTELSELIKNLQHSVNECRDCRRFFSVTIQVNTGICDICNNKNRDITKLLIVARDSDIQAIERSGVYEGLYFVLGGTIPLLSNGEVSGRLRSKALIGLIEQRLKTGLSEIILGFSVNPDGENTARYTEGLIREIVDSSNLKFSELGRGLSTGSELEYADPETIKSAIKNRS